MTPRPSKLPSHTAVLRQRILDRLGAEPEPGWVALTTLAREFRAGLQDVRSTVRALIQEGVLEEHDLEVFTRATTGDAA